MSFTRALLRTAIKLSPWELVHVSMFALSDDLSQVAPIQITGLVVVNVLLLFYLAVLAITKGRRSAHDLFVNTVVEPVYIR